MEKKKKKFGLERRKKKSGLFFFCFWLGHELGPISKRGQRGPWGPAGAGLGPGKKPGTLNGAGPGHGSCPAGRVRVWKNPARTRPVAIPSQSTRPSAQNRLTHLKASLEKIQVINSYSIWKSKVKISEYHALVKFVTI